jgi:dihydrofolate synthase/folylpolyglutamate synthase
MGSSPLPRGLQGGERLARALARLDALIDWERRARGGMRVSIAPAADLCARLGDPQRSWKTVHVTGSKGKGSTAALVAAGLEAAGLRIGRYGSPHVERIHERVVIGGSEIEDELLAEALELALEARSAAIAEGTSAAECSWFDLVTAAAFWAMARSRVEWAAVEVGLGGRLDSTNVVIPEVCVITNVELEHVQVLGVTREAIAREKSGIIKSGCTVVTGVDAGTEAGRVVDARAAELGATLWRPAPGVLAGLSFERRNELLAGAVLDQLGARGARGRDGRALSAALLTPQTVCAARLPGRLERFSVGGTPVVLDGAHTPESVAALVESLRDEWERRGPPVVVLGLARDKDLSGMLKHLRGRVDRLVCTSVGSALHRTPEEIASAAASVSLAAQTAATPAAALQAALDLASNGGWVLVAGSLYLAGSVRPLLRSTSPARSC